MLATALLLLSLPVAAPPPGAPDLAAVGTGPGVRLEVSGREAGPVTLWDGERQVAVLPAGQGPAAFETNASGTHTFVARRGAAASETIVVDAASGVVDPAAVSRPGAGEPTATGVGVTVTIPPGALTVTARCAPAGRTSVVTVTDTRAGELGFVVTVSVDRPTRLVRTWALQVQGNALPAAEVRTAHAAALRPGRALRVAALPAGTSLGSVRVGVRLADVARLTWTVL